MTGNRLSDLTAHLFDQLRRLDAVSGIDGTIDPDRLDAEIRRAEAVATIASEITKGAELQIKAAHLLAAHGDRMLHYLPAVGRDPLALDVARSNDAAKGGTPE